MCCISVYFCYLAHGALVGAIVAPSPRGPRDAHKLGGASSGSDRLGVQSALNIFPNTKCCTTGIFDMTSPSYSRSSPAETLAQDYN